MANSLKRCQVLITRAPTVTIPDLVYEYEVPVLEEIHGEQDVQVIWTRDVPLPEDFGAANAYAQLLRKFGDAKGQDAVRFVYRNVQALAKASGLPYARGDEDTIKYEQALVVNNDPADQLLADVAAKVAAAR